jgi:hypothetical protein
MHQDDEAARCHAGEHRAGGCECIAFARAYYSRMQAGASKVGGAGPLQLYANSGDHDRCGAAPRPADCCALEGSPLGIAPRGAAYGAAPVHRAAATFWKSAGAAQPPEQAVLLAAAFTEALWKSTSRAGYTHSAG